MALTFHRTLKPLSRLEHKFYAAFWLQSGACGVVAWSVLHGGITIPPTARTATDEAAGPMAPAAAAGTAASSLQGPAGATGAARPSPPTQLAAAPGLAEARLALSTIDVIVTRNDTLDRIFRRLKLNLADLATLRAVPGLHAMLDSLRPGERLRFKHHDGEFLGLERRLNESHTLKVSRDPTGLKADVLQDTLETRSRTVRGVIDHSLFEAVEAAGARDQIAVALADIFGWDIDFALDVRSGDAFVVTWDEIWRDGAAPIGPPVRAAGDGRIRFAGRRGGYGNVVEIEHIRSIVTVYGHLSRFAHGTRVGEHVAQGAVIAYVGMTGLATGPHLHYEYRVDGVFKNPQTVALPTAAPIDARWQADFLTRSAPLLASLNPAGTMLVSR